MSHCAIPGCTDPCRSRQLMCKWHWRKVPAHLKALVLDTWKAVQGRPAPTQAALEKRLTEIRSYREAVAAAVADVCRQEGLAIVSSEPPTEGAQI